MPRKRTQPERKLSPRHEFLSMFFGQVISSDVRDITNPGPSIELSENFGISSRERTVDLLLDHSGPASFHIIDLSPPKESPPSQHRPFEFSQKIAIFTHHIKRALRRPSATEFLSMNPQTLSNSRGSLREFLSLPLLFLKSFSLTTKPKRRRIKEEKTPSRIATTAAQISTPPKHIKPVSAPSAPKGPLFSKPARWKSSLASFGVIGAAVILPIFMLTAFTGILDDVDFAETQTTIAFENLKQAGKDAVTMNAQASTGFELAAENFADTRSRLNSATLQIGALVTGNGGKLKAGESLLSAGEEFSKAGAAMTAAFNALERKTDAETSERIEILLSSFGDALPHIDAGIDILEFVPERSIPSSHRETFIATLTEMRSLRDHAAAVTASSDTVLEILGSKDKRRYLVIFQNDRELRPTGGFIGSYALMDIKDGRIVNTEIPDGGSYDLRGGLTERIAAPEQLHLVNTRWEFQDANWFADFPSSARALTWFYEKSGGPTIDGVIAITSSFMEELLSVIGPVEIEAYNKTITAENFFIETQKAVEIEYDREANTPKAFISDMAPLVLSRLINLEGESLLPLVGTISRGVTSKHLMVNFRDGDEQALASDFGWAGEMKSLPNADFLAVIDTNIAGGKTDGVVHSAINHELEVMKDGSLIDTLTVRRTHHGQEGELFTGIKNIDYMRVFVPNGSTLLSAEGFERPGDGYFLEPDDTLKASTMLAAVEGRSRIDDDSGTIITEESGFTVFGNWIQLEPGESRAVRISYRLPFTIDDISKGPETLFERVKNAVGAYAPTARMKFVVHQQPGALHRTISSTIRFPNEWSVRSRIPDQVTYREGMLSYEGPLDKDLYIGSVLTKTD